MLMLTQKFVSESLAHYQFIQGCWRKVSVDDLLPYTEQPATSGSTEAIDNTSAAVEDMTNSADNPTAEVNTIPLYPRTANPVELWPAIIVKAVLKIAALE